MCNLDFMTIYVHKTLNKSILNFAMKKGHVSKEIWAFDQNLCMEQTLTVKNYTKNMVFANMNLQAEVHGIVVAPGMQLFAVDTFS